MSKHYANYCGYFSIKETTPFVLPTSWKPLTASDNEIAECKRFYYPEFIDFCIGNAKGACKRFVFNIAEKETNLTIRNRQYNISVDKIVLYVMPCDIAIYSIFTSYESDDLNDFTLIASSLRDVSKLGIAATEENDLSQFSSRIMEPIADAYLSLVGHKISGYGDLVEKGNKLKVYQIIDTPLESLEKQKRDVLLFEVGTLSQIGLYDSNDIHSFSEEYLKETLNGHKVSIYKNWSALALLDTFTIVACDYRDYVFESWMDDYFSKIYIHNLFIKFYLFRLNDRFRTEPDNSEALEDEFAEFERNFCFKKISYNFLPLEVDKKQDYSLEINEEKNLLYHAIEVENQRKEESSDKRLNNLLFFLTCITMVSAVWDACGLFDSLIKFETIFGTEAMGYRFAASILSLIIVIVAFFILRKKANRK